MNLKNDIIAVVVWYNPTQKHVENILSYMYAVNKVIIIDNSTYDNSFLISSNIEYSECIYIPLYENLGIATALNKGCKQAIQYGAKWILTMDQDSCWEKEQLEKYFDLASHYSNISDIGVFSPHQSYTSYRKEQVLPYTEKIAVMTSGCLLSATGFEKTNGFRDDFFIDEVDNEYCMHICQLGMRVVTINNAYLAHQLGELQKIKLFGIIEKEYTYHQPFRYYYIIRNVLALNQLYPIHKKFNNKRLCKIIKRILLYNQSHKCESIQMCLKGWCDFRKGIMGRIKN